MNYTYKGKLYTIKKFHLDIVMKYQDVDYPMMIIQSEDGAKIALTPKEFFDAHEKGENEEALWGMGNEKPEGFKNDRDRILHFMPILKDTVLFAHKFTGNEWNDNIALTINFDGNSKDLELTIYKEMSDALWADANKTLQDYIDSLKKDEKVIKEDEYLKLREIGFMNNIKVMPLKYTGGRPSSGACKKCEFYKNEKCELFENEIDTFCTRLEREDHTTIFYKKVNDSKSTKEPQDLIALLLEKMPFLDNEKFKLWRDKEHIYAYREGGAHCISIIDLDYDIRIKEHARRIKKHFDIT